MEASQSLRRTHQTIFLERSVKNWSSGLYLYIKREVTKDSVLKKFEAVSNRDDIDKNYINVTIDVSGFDEQLITSELITLQEYDRKPIYFDDGWETISGFISYFLYNETDKYVSLSVPVPNIIKLLEKSNFKNTKT